ncbi:FMN-dependent NADH-azoreductase [Actinomycetospora chiangmaiensis]|uniref:FMN-dependent NADH-azoreductase n=1 Tax=Actinomycetospora chiangmaiensis TaxID=402650 RepID=UPI00047606D6|nr:NAD(P)H-dependent oxidoreductase [Actinomycetospora chiangmaiensis]
MRLLDVRSSPRGPESSSRAVADALVAAAHEACPTLEVDTLDVWATDLPDFDASTIGTKYKLVSGDELSAEEDHAWAVIRNLVDRFRAADRIVVGAPMWNWSIPYRLKHLIDLVSQRGELFEFDGQEYSPALSVPRGAVLAVRGHSRDGTTMPIPGPPTDFHVDFVRFWLQIIGVREVDVLRVEHTWDARAAETLARGVEQAQELGKRLVS